MFKRKFGHEQVYRKPWHDCRGPDGSYQGLPTRFSRYNGSESWFWFKSLFFMTHSASITRNNAVTYKENILQYLKDNHIHAEIRYLNHQIDQIHVFKNGYAKLLSCKEIPFILI